MKNSKEIYNQYLKKENKIYFQKEQEYFNSILNLRFKLSYQEQELFNKFLINSEEFYNEKILDIINYIINFDNKK